jgi:outer membrane protein OmpA-like peptidoglycan-associated protein
LKIKSNGNIRHALLAGTMMLPVIAVPQAGMAADSSSAQATEGTIILAQAAPQGQAIDPATGKPLPKGVQPKGNQPPPKGPAAVPPGAHPPAAAVPPQPGQKLGVQPKGNQPVQSNVAPAATPPAAAAPPSPGMQPRQFGVQPKGNQPLQGNVAPSAAPPAAGAPPAAAVPPSPGVQPRQFGVQPKGNQPLQSNVAPAAPPPAAGAPPAAAAVPPKQPLQQQSVVPGAKPLPVPGAAAPVAPTPAPATAAVPGAKPLPVPGAAAPVPAAAAPTAMPSQAAAPVRIGAPVAPAVVVTGNVNQLHTQRQERREAGGRLVIEEPGRLIVREGNTTIIRHDETARFSVWGAPRVEVRGNEHFAYISRPGYDIINVTGPDGRLLRRVRRGPDGREVIIIDNSRGPGFAAGLAVGVAGGLILGLAAPVITIPRERYIVDISAAPAPLLYETLEAPPLVDIERPYSLDEIRYNVALRDRMRRIDVDSVTFDTGSWEVMPEQQPKLQVVADAVQRILARHPDEVFMIEGHTDAVGNDVDNLSLSDHRAESVAVILTNAFQIPPENLVTQGYGAQHLKIPTDGPSRENRRVTLRRITPLLQGKMARL